MKNVIPRLYRYSSHSTGVLSSCFPLFLLNERLVKSRKGNQNPHEILENSEEKVSHLIDLKETRTHDKVKIENNKAKFGC